MDQKKLEQLQKSLNGELHFDEVTRRFYATDASAYRELPLAVALPRDKADIKTLIDFARENGTGLIPRTAGTSLAGQVVGSGIVVDVSKYFNQILEINVDERWVRVQPGFIRDDLNKHLARHGLLFGPETSTASRAMIGGMIGNNSCGSNSIIYGSTREHLVEAEVMLSDGTAVTLQSLTDDQFAGKCNGSAASERERAIYRELNEILSDGDNQVRIRTEYPKASIPRRNTGYALDILADNRPFNTEGEDFNLCRLFAGSEGTLGFLLEAKLNLMPIPRGKKALVCIHFEDIIESLKANVIAIKYQPTASELIDHYILECTKENIEQRPNRFFVKGDPKTILVVELLREDEKALDKAIDEMVSEMRKASLGYHYPVLKGEDMPRIWSLRKAGLGLLGNIPGDAKAVPVVEDTAVDTDDLPGYIEEFEDILKEYKLTCMYYAHAGTGELHMRPIINLKTREGNEMFRTIAQKSADLVKKYQGSLSGEHGDGRLRGEFIPQMVGEENYQLLKRVKKAWDPQNIFNPGKIVDTPPMNSFLRYEPGQETPEVETVFDYEKNGGFLREIEKCNGAGVCRKTQLSGGTMCPSYMATKDEKDTTRARANVLREMITHSKKANRFDHHEIKEVMELCLSCKGCKSECPSNIDMARYKAEFQHQYYKANGIPFRTRMIGDFDKSNRLASRVPGLYNFLTSFPPTASIAKKIMGIAPQRSFPQLHQQTLRQWIENFRPQTMHDKVRGRVHFFCDEFTNYHDTDIGIKAIQLLDRLGYRVVFVQHEESGRTMFSKGLLDPAREIAIKNVSLFKDLVKPGEPLIGIEPSAILTFRDEYPGIVPKEMRGAAQKLAESTFLIDEFLVNEMNKGVIRPEQFDVKSTRLMLHGHCHQKALSGTSHSEMLLSGLANYAVEVIPSGCCGMAGSFGYEKEHYDVSMKVGELVLFPAVRQASGDTVIAATGTSCRHQIKDGTGRVAKHPVEILFDALRDEG